MQLKYDTCVNCPTCTWPRTSKAITAMKAQQSPGMEPMHYHSCTVLVAKGPTATIITCTLYNMCLSHPWYTEPIADKLFATSWRHAFRKDKAVLQKCGQAFPRVHRETQLAMPAPSIFLCDLAWCKQLYWSNAFFVFKLYIYTYTYTYKHTHIYIYIKKSNSVTRSVE